MDTPEENSNYQIGTLEDVVEGTPGKELFNTKFADGVIVDLHAMPAQVVDIIAPATTGYSIGVTLSGSPTKANCRIGGKWYNNKKTMSAGPLP